MQNPQERDTCEEYIRRFHSGLTKHSRACSCVADAGAEVPGARGTGTQSSCSGQAGVPSPTSPQPQMREEVTAPLCRAAAGTDRAAPNPSFPRDSIPWGLRWE